MSEFDINISIQKLYSILPKLEKTDFKKQYKLIIGGDGAVGKTCIAKRLQGKKYSEHYNITVAVEFTSLEVKLEIIDETVNMQIWDVSGQSHFEIVRRPYYAGADIGLVVFDLSRLTTLDSITSWVNNILINSGKESIPFIIVANKFDLIENNSSKSIIKTLKEIEARLRLELMEHFDSQEIIFYPISAVTNLNLPNLKNLLLLKAIKWDLKL